MKKIPTCVVIVLLSGDPVFGLHRHGQGGPEGVQDALAVTKRSEAEVWSTRRSTCDRAACRRSPAAEDSPARRRSRPGARSGSSVEKLHLGVQKPGIDLQ